MLLAWRRKALRLFHARLSFTDVQHNHLQKTLQGHVLARGGGGVHPHLALADPVGRLCRRNGDMQTPRSLRNTSEYTQHK